MRCSMIANLVNVLAGLWLSYIAIFSGPGGMAGRWSLIAVIVLAIIARRGDFSRWQSSTNVVLGAILLALAVANLAWVVPALVLFWVELWIGLAVAIFALWAVLYRPETKSPVGAEH